MDHDFWHQKWKNNEIGFHREEINEFLQKYYPSNQLSSKTKVFVPLCGKSIDMLWLNQRGAQVVGSELSLLACQQFFTENNLEMEHSESNEFIHLKHNSIELLSGDFFKLSLAQLGKIDFCYDRAALVALPPDLRIQYANKMAELLPTGALYLLITYNYSKDNTIGPPFSVDSNEVINLFGDNFTITFLEQQAEDPNSLPALAKRGISQIMNQIYMLKRK
ncbi:MAG: thiopurine S-methyltransferase [Neisseriaceae bacterium]|nr:MAG: thiopurine S-methyltransferase [Neisseriaceae bacterium]